MAVKLSRSGARRVRKCDESGGAMLVIRSLRRVRKSQGKGREVRTLIFNGTRRFLLKRPN